MSLLSLVALLFVAGFCGSIGRSLVGYSHTGCVASVVLGFIGATLGMWIARWLHLPEVFVLHIGRETFPVLWSIVGSAAFVAVLSAFSRPPRF